MKFRHITLFFLVSILIGCTSLKNAPYEPAHINSLKELNGTYINYGDSLAFSLGIGSKDIDLITLNFEDNESLEISYYTDTGIVHLRYKGELKNNFFETYLEKKKLIMILFNDVSTKRIRIGNNKEKKLYIQHEYSYSSNFLFFGGGSDFSKTYSWTNDTISRLYPFKKNNKWGYKFTITDSVAIEPKYDYAKLFEDNIARVKLNGKWLLINNKGKALTEPKYDKIMPFSTSRTTAMAYIHNKKGFLDKNGIEVVPVIYDEFKIAYYDYIGQNIMSNDIVRSKIGDKYGYINNESVIFPAVFDKASLNSYSLNVYSQTDEPMSYIPVKIDNTSYLINKRGDLYRYKHLFIFGKKLIPESKIFIYDLLDQKGIPYTIAPSISNKSK